MRELPLKYTKGRFIGKGGFARVYELLDSETGQQLAVKIVSKASIAKPRAQAKLKSEISIHRSLNHEKVVKFHDYYEDSKNVYIVLEYCPNQTLNEYLKRRSNRRMEENEALFYIYDLILALKYLSTNRILHRDLKLGNLFLDHNMRIKIGDFGLAAQLKTDKELRKTICGTPNYIAPEILDGKNGHSFEVDIWSLGVILYTMLVGKPPFETNDVKETYKRIRSNSYSFPEHVTISKQSKDLIRTLLSHDPKNRPKLEDIILSSWMQQIRLPPPMPASVTEHKNYLQRRKEKESQQAQIAGGQGDGNNNKDQHRHIETRVERPDPRINQENRMERHDKKPNSTRHHPISARTSQNMQLKEPSLQHHNHNHNPLGLTTPTGGSNYNISNQPDFHNTYSGYQLNRGNAASRSNTPDCHQQLDFARLDSPARYPLRDRSPSQNPANVNVGNVGNVRDNMYMTSPIGARPDNLLLPPKLRENPNNRPPSGYIQENEENIFPNFDRNTTYSRPSSARPPAERRQYSTTTPRGLRTSQRPMSARISAGSATHANVSTRKSRQPSPSFTRTPVNQDRSKNKDQSPAYFFDQLNWNPDQVSSNSVRPRSSTPKELLPKDGLPELWVTKWVDYSSKYGIGYIFSDESIGVYFNDSTKMILESSESIHFEYITRRTVETAEERSSHTLDNFPDSLKKKVTLLRHFKNYLVVNAGLDNKRDAQQATLGESGLPVVHPNPPKPKEGLRDEKKPYVKKWMKNKHAIMFQLSNKIVQVVFFDRTEVVLSSRAHMVTYVDRKEKRAAYQLKSVMDISNPELAKRLRYTKDILVNLLGGKKDEKVRTLYSMVQV